MYRPRAARGDVPEDEYEPSDRNANFQRQIVQHYNLQYLWDTGRTHYTPDELTLIVRELEAQRIRYVAAIRLFDGHPNRTFDNETVENLREKAMLISDIADHVKAFRNRMIRRRIVPAQNQNQN